jgi:nitrate/nitrite transport system substrate-binding protein
VRVGFLPLTDCAPVVVAAALGFDRKYGIRIRLSRQGSWAAVRDRVLAGELDAAHLLYGLVYGVQLGVGGMQREMAVLMGLNQNGQGITLSSRLRDSGVTDGESLARAVREGGRRLVFAQTFPTGTHAMWLNYWLASYGIDPLRDVDIVSLPPARMVAALRAEHIDGCCVGEPWNAVAIREGVGITAATSQQVWCDHPEKVLGATREFVARHPDAALALIMAVLEGARYADQPANRASVARLLGGASYLDMDARAILPRLLGDYEDGRGHRWTDPHAVRFHADGAVNFPYLSDGMWFMTQQRRWGLLAQDPDYEGIARRVQHTDLYRQAAEQLGVALPASPMRTSLLMDGIVWDGSAPLRYAAQSAIRVA